MRMMKDSGIEWIGKIPDNWNTPPLKSRYTFGKGLSITKADLSEEGAKIISYGQIHSKSNNGVSTRSELIRYIPWDHNNLTNTARTQPGDLIFADTSEDIQGCGNCVYIDLDGVYAGYHTLFLHPKYQELGRYYAYLFASDAWRAQIRERVTGVKLYSITQDILKSTLLLEPPFDEQERIVSFLDEKCRDIDRLITEKERNIILLKERRQSIIYEAVTKGLNPDAPMKDSGVEWIGQIPEKWTVWRMKHLAEEPLQYGANATGVEFDETLPRYVRITDITSERKLADDGKQSLPIETAKDYMLEDGDILLARSGATAGKSYYYENSDGACCFAGYLIRFRANNAKANSKFLYYYTLTQPYEQWTQQIFIQATIQNISAEKYNNLCFAIPDTLEEQKRIVEYLDEKCAEIDSIITINNKSIQQLKEYRQSLIYEVVTGKKEV